VRKALAIDATDQTVVYRLIQHCEKLEIAKARFPSCLNGGSVAGTGIKKDRNAIATN